MLTLNTKIPFPSPITDSALPITPYFDNDKLIKHYSIIIIQ